MALKRWGWTWGPPVAALFVALLLLPAGGETGGPFLSFLQGSFGSERNASFRYDVQRANDVQRARLRDAERADSLMAAARGPWAVRSRDGGVAVAYEAPLTAADARGWLAAVEKELGRYPAVAGPGAPLVVALYSNPARATGRGATLHWTSVRRQPPGYSGSACVVEVNVVPQARRAAAVRRVSPSSIGAFLGPCGLYRRFGLPGPDVARWMLHSGWPTYGSTDGGWMATLSEATRSVQRIEMQRPDFSNLRPWEWYWDSPWVSIGCLDGSLSLCERALRFRRGDHSWWSYSDPRVRELVAFLLARGTPAQFAAFWLSPLGVSDAVRQAYGRPPGQLAHDALSHWYSTARGGPRARPRLLFAGLFWAAAALALALVAGRRRTTEI